MVKYYVTTVEGREKLMFAKKLFSLDPLIYKVDESFYDFGDGNYIELKAANRSAAKYQVNQLQKMLQQNDPEKIRQIFNRMKSFASACSKEAILQNKFVESINDFEFSTEQIQQVEEQTAQYMDIYHRYIST